MEPKKLSLFALVWPIMIELLLQFMIGTADTLMVSRISDDAVAVVGLANQFFQAVIMLFVLISSGAGIVISQKLGAGQLQAARSAAAMSFIITLGIGVLVSLGLYFGADLAAVMLQTPPELQAMTAEYILVVGSGTIFTAAVLMLSTIIRSMGNTKAPMLVAVGMNLVHIAGNYAFIFGEFGFPQWGLFGVALSTVGSRLAALLVLYGIYRQAFGYPIRVQEYLRFDKLILSQIAKVGWPMALSSASWSLSQVVLFSMIATMGPEQLAARTYLNTLESFSFLAGWAFAMAVQIEIAHLYGAGRMNEAYRSAFRALLWGEIVVGINTLLLLLFGQEVLALFTADPEIIRLGVGLILLNLLLQPLKMLNMPLNNSLNAVGDTRFVMVAAMVSMWGIAVGGTYVLGIMFGWAIYGAYAAMILDELIRGIAVLRRWMARKYLPLSEEGQGGRGAAAAAAASTVQG